MSPPPDDVLTLAAAVVLVLSLLTLAGRALRARMPEDHADPLVETYFTRVRSWWAMVALLGLAVLIGEAGVVVLFALASFAALREIVTYTMKTRADHLSLALAFFAVLPLQYVFVGMGLQGLFGTFIPVYAFLLLPVFSALRGAPDGFLVRVSETQWALMTAVFCLSHVPALMTLDIPGHGGRGVFLIVFFLICVQGGDLIEYGFGRRLGRVQVASGISPKTREGMAAGVAGAALIGAGLAWATPFGVAGAMAMAAAASAAGMAGSLVFSAIKRDRGVRDWSHLIPGQGGFMDQFDSAIFAAPVFFHLTGAFWAG
jgi:phosphatidate cytidylyltransferase